MVPWIIWPSFLCIFTKISKLIIINFIWHYVFNLFARECLESFKLVILNTPIFVYLNKWPSFGQQSNRNYSEKSLISALFRKSIKNLNTWFLVWKKEWPKEPKHFVVTNIDIKIVKCFWIRLICRRKISALGREDATIVLVKQSQRDHCSAEAAKHS